MRFGLKVCCIAMFLISQAITSVANYTIVESGSPIIDKMTQNYRGKSLTLSEIDRIIREISQDGLFQVVYAEETTEGRVLIRAQQSVKLNKILISGNNSFKEEELLKIMDIEEGKALSDLEIAQSVERIRDVYQNSGFYNFQIRHSKTIDDSGMTLSITIDEKDSCIIEDITVFTKNDFLKSRVQEVLNEFTQMNYQKETANRIEKALNEFLLENRFLTAKVQNTATIFNESKTRVKLKFNITDSTQYEFVFHGNHFFSHFDLINESQIGTKTLYVSDSSSDILESVSEAYVNSGFPLVSVQLTERYLDESQKRIFVFEINEGPRIRIGKVEVVGKLSRKKSFYVALFNKYLAEEAHSVYFVEKDVEHAAEAMVTHLKRQGHLLAELLSVNYEISDQEKALVTIQVDEGILTYVRQILFRGSKSFSNIQLKEEVAIEANKPLNITEIEESFDKLERFYKEKGFLEFSIKNRNATVIQYKQGQPYADIVYEMEEGPKIVVRDIVVNGLEKTKKYVVIRELDFEKGDLLRYSRVANSIDRLEKTGLFGKVNIRSAEQGSSNGDRTIVVEVEERKPGLFSSGVGLLVEGRPIIRGSVGTLYNNLGGKARGFSTRLDLTYQKNINYPENRLALAYYDPFIFKNRVRGRLSLVREERLLTEDREKGNHIIQSRNEIRFSSEKEFSKHLRFTYNVWSFSNQETFGTRVEDRKILNIATTGPILEWDYRNDPFVPTDGNYSRFELEYSDPLIGSSRDNPGVTGLTQVGSNSVFRRTDENNEINYYRASFLTTHYTPLTKSKRWVWANSLRGGYLQNLSNRNDSGVPQVRSFFLGGSSTIRGFSFGTTETVPGVRELCLKQGLIDSSMATNECRLDDVFVRKDSAFLLVKSELRFPISGAFGGLLFYDGGGVILGDFDLEDPYRDSIGFGFSYDTPVGSFVLELGYKLDRKQESLYYDKESAVALHLAIGTF